MPRSARARTSLRRLSWVCCTTPGIDSDRLGRVDALLHEQRRDEVVDRARASADEPAQRRACAAAGAAAARGTARLNRTGRVARVRSASKRTDERGDEAVDGVLVGLGVDAEAAVDAPLST